MKNPNFNFCEYIANDTTTAPISKYASLFHASEALNSFATVVPFALVLLAFLELNNFPKIFLHCLAFAFMGGRLAYSEFVMGNERKDVEFKVLGQTISWIVLAVASVAALYNAAGCRAGLLFA